ncbi:unnamed protein product, partial [marine sediment metagenome]
MESRGFALPDYRNYEYGHKFAYELACKQLAKIGDIDQQCLRSGAECRVIDSRKVVFLKYLNQSYRITLPDINISLADSDEEVPIRYKILILHYFIHAKGTPLTNKLIAYKELPSGAIYFPTFSKRAIKPIVDYFGKEPAQLISVA